MTQQAADAGGTVDSALDAKSLESLLKRLTEWATAHRDVRAVALVGSYARGTPTTQSDVDLVILTTSPDKYLLDEQWIRELGLGKLVATKPWGAITERRLKRNDGLEIELGIGLPSWASTDPVDAGTQRVVRDGMRIAHDPDHLLRRLIETIESSSD